MPLLTRAWIAYGRLRRRIGKPPFEAFEEGREGWVREHAPGRTFADIGGLFRYAGDIALLAEASGATKTTLMDAGDPDLTEFIQKREQRDSSVRFVQGGVEDPETIEAVGPHDIVWCTGVIYHTPNPVRQLMLLREITREFLYLGTHTVPDLPGLRNLCVYYPEIGEGSRKLFASAHHEPDNLWGIGRPFDYRPMWGNANFWWGISPSALRAMLATARFEVVEERRVRETPFFTEIVARPVDEPPLLPPLNYFRERGKVRETTGERLAFDDYYEQRADTSDSSA
ncbi:MAG: class I SAM-dependent methyltransferase [Thermoleophilaceae bacterium]